MEDKRANDFAMICRLVEIETDLENIAKKLHELTKKRKVLIEKMRERVLKTG